MSDSVYYTSSAGVQQTMLAQTVRSNNLANVNTNGFRADLAHATSMPLEGEHVTSNIYAVPKTSLANLALGSINTTGRDLDVALKGQGWIAVQSSTGQEAYTRAGSLQLTTTGQLQTSAGFKVLGEGGAITLPPAETTNIGEDGTITIRPLGQTATGLAVIDRIKLVDPEVAQLQKGSDGLFYLKNGGSATPSASVSLIPGALESANVNAVHELVELMSLSRQLEIQIKMMQTTKSSHERLTQLMQL